MSQGGRPAGPSTRRARTPSTPARKPRSASKKVLVNGPLLAQFSRRFTSSYDPITEIICDSSHWGRVGRATRSDLVTTQPIGPQPARSSSHWYRSSSTCNRSYLLAGVRAGLIALVLLAILAVIVWF
jgi:hypothetical protein